jgi:hypothetical protein
MIKLLIFHGESATIRIHRYQAFSDIPVFVKDYCNTASPGPTDEFASLSMSPDKQDTNDNVALAPLTQPQSASLCVDAALTIARQLQQVTTVRSPEVDMALPSLMPISTCCGMEAAHSIVMQISGIRISQASQGSLQQLATADRLLDEMFLALERILQNLDHHARTYVAITGMRGM